jgi:uncharacterized protein (DUF885 family)
MFDAAYQEVLERSPIELTRQGLPDQKGAWDELTPEEAKLRIQIVQNWWTKIASADQSGLNPEEKLSVRLFKSQVDEQNKDLEFFECDYILNQLSGSHTEIPAFLANNHKIDSYADAINYLERLEGLPKLFKQLREAMQRREQAGILPPKFVFDYVLRDIDSLMQGVPLTTTDPKIVHPICRDFLAKIARLQLQQKDEIVLRSRLDKAMLEAYQPAYQQLRQLCSEQQKRADDNDGIWKLPKGRGYYAHLLAKYTTTDLSPEQVHKIGLDEVERIQGEMKQILSQLNFQGELPAFFQACRTNPELLYPNDDAGRAAYLKDATAVVDRMRTQLDRLFLTKPKSQLVVKAVEPYREKSAPKAFYETGTADGKRPGIYYANLSDMSCMPRYEMEALAYHEAIPGHHMQLSIANEMTGIPKFRRNAYFGAYIEGWGLYCEQLPKEHGFYQDPYSNFGRLAMELFRAVRLVVDTGIHHKRWTRAQGVAYYLANTPNSQVDCQRMVDRHIVWPGQATAYKVGMMEILRLREKAKTKLGDRFDLREFHDVVLLHGALPLKVLEELVDDYIATKGS